jgi:hypothetical protein
VGRKHHRHGNLIGLRKVVLMGQVGREEWVLFEGR